MVVRRDVHALGPDTVVVAHSLGCLPVAHLAAGGLPCRAVVLVAPPDVHGPSFPTAAVSFVGLAQQRCEVPVLVVSSGNDPYCASSAAEELVSRWGAERVDISDHGHINAESGLGSWEQGWELVQVFAARHGSR